MYPNSSSQQESHRGPYAPDHRYGYSNEQSPVYRNTPSRPFELPRPLEPQPTHSSAHSYSDVSGPHRHRDSFGRIGNGLPKPRPSNQSLPGVRDILHPTTTTEHRSSTFASPWTPSNSAPSASRPNSDGYYPQPTVHPPLAIPPPAEHHGEPHRAENHRMELPILETHPVERAVERNHAPPPPTSPYRYQEHPRDYMEARSERPRQMSTSFYAGMISPYTPSSASDAYQMAPPPSYERTGSAAGVAPEIQRKYLGIHDIPGEGRFHMYEGGYRTPTHVDGDYVNPQWGLTKANKPRKRLALACLDCREKKIKCEPGQNACLQCEKTKRVCRRAPNTAQPLQQGETTPSTAWSTSTATPVRPNGGGQPSGPNAKPDVPEGEPDSAKRRVKDVLPAEEGPSKKHQSASPMALAEHLPPVSKTAPRNPQIPAHSSPLEQMRGALSIDVDPMFVEPETSMHLLDCYLEHVNSATYAMFPRHSLRRWAENCHHKCQNEIMVLYAMLAVGSIFADSSFGSFGKFCATIAVDIVSSKHGRFSLPLVQSRLLLGLFNFAKGKEGAAWDYCGSAIRAISGLNFNLERDCHDDSAAQIHPRREFDFTKEQLTECKRRTFWAAFLMDRYNGFCGGTLCILHPDDVFIKLPCDDETYERGLASQAPKYHNGITNANETTMNSESPVAPVAWLCLISAIWGEVMTFIYRAQNRPQDDPAGYKEAYETFYQRINTAMQGWYNRLPPYLTYSEQNLDRSIQAGYPGTFISIHALYHFTQVRLNRGVRHSLVPEIVPRNIRTAHTHAHRFLQLMCSVGTSRREILHPMPGQCPTWTLSTPFSGYALLCAVDVVGAGGLDTNLGATLESIKGALSCLRELKQFWESAKEQSRDAEKRCYQIQNIVKNPMKAKSGCWLGRSWGVEKALALDTDFPPKDDCIYGVESRVYFDALREGVQMNGGSRVA